MTLTMAEQTAHEALRARQGDGARYDAEAAPHHDLLQARRNTSYFARVLNELRDDDLSNQRRRVIAEVSYNARACATALEQLEQAEPEPYDVEESVARGITLPPRALRALFQHSEIHLNVTWRDLSADDWEKSIDLGDQTVDIRDTPKHRAEFLARATTALSKMGATTAPKGELT